jgi:hypothetical protein
LLKYSNFNYISEKKFMSAPITNILLPGTIQAAAPGLKGFDTVAVITAATAVQFKNSGFAFCIRYLSLGSIQSDLSHNEALGILNSGLALSVVQRTRRAGSWIATGPLGASTGANAASNAKSIGLPPGMVVWCDLETPDPTTPAQGVIDYCQAWFTAVQAAGYVPGLYVGAGAILDGNQLFSNLSFQHYWHSQSKVPDVAVRGYQMIQAFPSVDVNGVEVDTDTTMTDHKGGTVLWLKI